MRRLGSNGPLEVSNHPWLINFDWEKLEDMSMISPFKPSANDNFDMANS